MKTSNDLLKRYSGLLCHNLCGRRTKLSFPFYHLMLLITLLGLSFLSIQTQAQFPSTMELGNLCGPNGFVVNGISGIDQVGSAISSAGDLNGDGYDDLIFGAFAGDPNGSNSGESYVVFGTPNGFDASLELSDLDGTNGFTLNGIDAGDGAGTAVSSAGDFNGDGYNDIIIGADDADPNDFGFSFGSGAAYVVFGNPAGFSPVIELSALDGTNGFSLNGVDEREGAGTSVSSAGDFNGDGFDDVMIGAPDADPNGGSSGATYIVFGGTTSLGASFNLSDLDGTNGLVINGAIGSEYSGSSISSAGDFNGDGVDDVIIGGPDGSFGPETGNSYLVFGSTGGFADSLELSALDGTNGFVLNGINEGDLSGFSVSSAGDFNGDGFDDIIIGAHFADPNGNRSGETYVVFGGSGSFGASFNLSDLDGTNGFVMNGINEGDQLGYSVSSAGDVNNDGVDDVIIGARAADSNGSSSGASYVVFGNTSGLGSSLDLSDLDGTNGFVLNGVEQFDRSGSSVSSAGDINGDGAADLIVGASGANPNGDMSGESYVVFGSCGPSLLVQGNEMLIPNCADNPQVEDLTLFEASCTQNQTYVLGNSLGTDTLIITSISSSNPAFSIDLNNFPINIPAGSDSILLLPINYTATGDSIEVSEITIESNDCNDLTYVFKIQYQDSDSLNAGCVDSTATNYNPNAICDDGSCVYETAGLTLDLKILLEGPYNVITGTMNTNLNDSNLIPSIQPYNQAPWNYTGSESANVMPANAVDWVLVELRTGTPSLVISSTSVSNTQAALLLNDGTVVDPVTQNSLIFEGVTSGNYHIAIRHRNHLDAMSSTPVSAALGTVSFDFTTGVSQAFGPTQLKMMSNGKSVAFAADLQPNGVIQTTDYDIWFSDNAGINVYKQQDGNLDGVIQATDYDLWFLNKSKIGLFELQLD